MQNINRLRWQCRRGVKELDTVLCAFLDNQYMTATVEEQQLFVELLGLEDDRLLVYFFSPGLAVSHPDKTLEQFIEQIRTAFVG